MAISFQWPKPPWLVDLNPHRILMSSNGPPMGNKQIIPSQSGSRSSLFTRWVWKNKIPRQASPTGGCRSQWRASAPPLAMRGPVAHRCPWRLGALSLAHSLEKQWVCVKMGDTLPTKKGIPSVVPETITTPPPEGKKKKT